MVDGKAEIDLSDYCKENGCEIEVVGVDEGCFAIIVRRMDVRLRWLQWMKAASWTVFCSILGVRMAVFH